MDYHIISPEDSLWETVSEYAKACSWSAGKKLGVQMEKKDFEDWERMLIAMDNETIIGFCTLTAKDSLPESEYTPFIGYVFVDENYRGKRVSEQMIRAGSLYLERLGYSSVYIYSGHEGLYEKYGFKVVKKWKNEDDEWDKIFTKRLKRQS